MGSYGAGGEFGVWVPECGNGSGQKWRKSQAAQVSSSPVGFQLLIIFPLAASAATLSSICRTVASNSPVAFARLASSIVTTRMHRTILKSGDKSGTTFPDRQVLNL